MLHALSDGYVLRVVSGQSGGAMAPLDATVTIGREGDLRIEDSTVSRRHAQVSRDQNGAHLVDLGSSSGTILNGNYVERAELKPGDRLTLGRTELIVLRLVRYSDAAAGPAIRLQDQGHDRVVAVRDGLIIGRDATADVVTDDSTVSRKHAQLRVDPAGVSIEDLRSANGTRVAGETVTGRTRLSDGVAITLGKAPPLTFLAGAPTGAVAVRVSAEGESSGEQIEIDAGPEASVAQVTAELARSLGASDQELVIYRSDDGVLLHPDDRWNATGVRAGDNLALGLGDAAMLAPAKGRRWPSRRDLSLNQLPRTVWPAPSHHVARIDTPESASFKGRGVIWQVAGGLGAVLIGLIMVLVNPSFWPFAVITGGVGIVSIAASVLGDQSRRRHKVDLFRRRLNDLNTELTAAAEQQAVALRLLSPSVDEIESWVRGASPRLWERRPSDPDALNLTIGRATRRLRVDYEQSRDDDSPLVGELERVKSLHAHLEDVPATVPGPQVGSLGITGQTARTRALMERMVIEAAIQHAPGQLSIWIAGTDRSWEWTRWLPHVGTNALSTDSSDAVEVLNAATRELNDTGGAPGAALHMIVVPDAGIRFDLGKLTPLCPGHGLLLVSSPESRGLPSGLAVVLDISSEGYGTLTGGYHDAPVGYTAVDGINTAHAERIAVELSRVSGGTTGTGPSGVVELLGLGSATTVDVTAAWARTRSDSLTVPIGSDDSGEPVAVGFRRDGPHAMVAGTTGSGKSELLQTLLAAEVLTNPPDRLNLFLIDFKGGATFAPLVGLPHVVGLVTDIEHDSSLANRAFTSLDAEISRRKRLLDSAGVPDIKAYERLRDRPVDDMANLVVVIDEFALLVERQPEVKERLDTIATQGRSLGIHMVLATQSPSGVITHAIRTNTNLWICLRVVTDSESVEILGTRDAARISDRSPGRAIIRLGAGSDLRQFQAARVGRPVPAEDTPVTVTRLGSGSSSAQILETASSTTELDVVARRVIEAFERSEATAPEPLWLDPLPSELRPDDFDQPTLNGKHLQMVVGLKDDPGRHSQEPYTVDLSESGHMLIGGVFGAGKSTTLKQIATDLSGRYAPSDVHIYAIDGGAGSLRPLVQLPHVGDVVTAGDTERVTRLVDRIDREVARRRELPTIADGGGFVESRPVTELPWIVLMVDDYPAFREVAEGVENGRLLERFNGMLQSGPSVGVHVVVAITQAVDVRTREINLMSARLVLRSADPADYALVDPKFTPADVPPDTPGRGLVAGPVEVQVANPTELLIAEIVKRWPESTRSRAWPPRVRRLPTTVTVGDLERRSTGVAIGLGGPEVETVAVELATVSPVLLVAGPRQSGRSTALVNLSRALLDADRSTALVLSPRPGPWNDDVGVRIAADRYTVVRDPAEYAESLDKFLADAPAGGLLVLDDAEALAGIPGVAERLDRILRRAGESDLRVLVAARVNDLPGLFDPWARYLVSLRRVLLLQPTADDSFLFGQKLPTIPPPSVPGRGLLIEGIRSTPVQLVGP